MSDAKGISMATSLQLLVLVSSSVCNGAGQNHLIQTFSKVAHQKQQLEQTRTNIQGCKGSWSVIAV
jgi:hypothetical protein